MTRKPVMHLMITDQCNRNCKYCCNKQYDVKSIPFATREEFESVDTVCLTGGEPFKYEEPCWIAGGLKSNYPNIKNIYMYIQMQLNFLNIFMKKISFRWNVQNSRT